MTISTLIGTRLLSGLAAFALTGSLVGGTAIAAQPDSSVREIRHEVRDQSKVQRDDIKQLRGEFAAEYAKADPDADKLAALQAAIDAKRAEISAMRFDALIEMHDSLDAAQRERMAERMAAGHGPDKAKHGNDEAKPAKDKAKHSKGKAKPSKANHGDDTADAKGKGKGKTRDADKAERPERGTERPERGQAKGPRGESTPT